MPEQFTSTCVCPPPGLGVAPSLLPYVYSVNDLQGQITLGNTGAIIWTSIGNTLFADLSASAGLGTVTSVDAASDNSNLTVTGGPVTTIGTLTFDLVGNVGSIADLVMAADQTIYSTGPGVFVATSLTAFGRSLIDDAAAVNARSTLGLVIGTDVQAFSQDLADFVSAASWPAGVLTLSSGVTLTGATGLTLTNADISGIGASFTDNITVGDSIVVTNSVTAATFAGNGAALTALNGTQVTTGTVDETVGGTGNTSYVAGDLLQGTAANVLSKLSSVAAGSYLRSGGVTTASVWSTLVLPNAGTVGDIFHCTSSNTMGRLTAVATGNVLLSGGVATASAWGKVTLAHTSGDIAGSGANGDISSFTLAIDFVDQVNFQSQIFLNSMLNDGAANPGNSGDILTSTGTATEWTNQIAVSTIRVDGLISSEATLTAAGATGAQTINKMTGTVRFAAAATTLIITNSLALAASTRALATVCTNDTTLKSVCAVVTDGFITLTANAAATAETEVFWELRGLT